MNVSFTKKQEKYVADQVGSGDYQNASEVVRDALRLHQYYRQNVIEGLKAEIQKGWNSPLSLKSVSDILAEKTTD